MKLLCQLSCVILLTFCFVCVFAGEISSFLCWLLLAAVSFFFFVLFASPVPPAPLDASSVIRQVRVSSERSRFRVYTSAVVVVVFDQPLYVRGQPLSDSLEWSKPAEQVPVLNTLYGSVRLLCDSILIESHPPSLLHFSSLNINLDQVHADLNIGLPNYLVPIWDQQTTSHNSWGLLSVPAPFSGHLFLSLLCSVIAHACLPLNIPFSLFVCLSSQILRAHDPDANTFVGLVLLSTQEEGGLPSPVVPLRDLDGCELRFLPPIEQDWEPHSLVTNFAGEVSLAGESSWLGKEGKELESLFCFLLIEETAAAWWSRVSRDCVGMLLSTWFPSVCSCLSLPVVHCSFFPSAIHRSCHPSLDLHSSSSRFSLIIITWEHSFCLLPMVSSLFLL